MRKSLLLLLVAIMSLTYNPVQASVSEIATPAETAAVEAHVRALTSRLNEIKEMDKSELSRSEKKELRKEVKAIKADLKSSGNGGIYLSVGAIIIIVLLLILLL